MEIKRWLQQRKIRKLERIIVNHELDYLKEQRDEADRWLSDLFKRYRDEKVLDTVELRYCIERLDKIDDKIEKLIFERSSLND